MEFEIDGTKLRSCRDADEIVRIPPGVQSIATGAFEKNETIREVYIPEGVLRVGQFAFPKCKNLRKVVLPNSLREIDCFAFVNCTALEEVTLGNQVEMIRLYAFFGCTNLKRILFPRTLRGIGEAAFACCIRLQEAVIPEGVSYIGKECFYSCYGLRRVFLPASVEEMGPSAFGFCCVKDLQVDPANPWFRAEKGKLLSKDRHTFFSSPVIAGTVSIPDSITILGGGALKGSLISQVNLPPGLQRIEREALSGCDRLREVSLPKDLQWIGERAFADSAITELVVPESVEYIGDMVLAGCKVQHLTILGSKTKVYEVCEKEDLQPGAMITADSMEIRDYPWPFFAVHGLRSVAARLAAGKEVPEAVLERFRKYLSARYADHLDEPQILGLAVSWKVIPLEGLDAAVRKAAELRDPAVTAALLQYQHEMFSQEQIQKQWEKQMREEMS